MAGGRQIANHRRQRSQALSRIDAADAQQANAWSGAGVGSCRKVGEAQCRRLGFVDARAVTFVLGAQRRAVDERQRPPGHVTQRPFFKRDILREQQLLDAAIAEVRQQRFVVADDQQEDRLAPCCGDAEREDRGRRRHAEMNHVALIDPLAQPRSHRPQLRVELPRPREVRQRRQRHVGRPHARTRRRRRVEHRHRQDDAVEVRRDRIHVARKRTFRFPQRAIRGLPERHVVEDAERHASPFAASRRS